jgi:hypothetical protein
LDHAFRSAWSAIDVDLAGLSHQNIQRRSGPFRNTLDPQETLQLLNRSSSLRSRLSRTVAALLATVLLVAGGARLATLAAPGDSGPPTVATAQNVDWMSEEMARSLDLGFAVLVPTSIPAPYSSPPSVSASGGYYSLYWGPSGGFLEISGTVGGSLPAGSPADLNNELFINASVQGYPAIHDVTSIYDSVWWIAGGVLYQVNGLNVSIGSLDLANSLVTLVPPAPEPEPTEPPAEPTEEPAGEAESPTPDPDETPDSNATETPTPDPDETPDPDATETPTVTPEDEGADILSGPATVNSGASVSISVDGAEASDLIASDGAFVDTDGTGIVDVQDGNIAWRAPLVDEETTVTFQLLVSATGEFVDEFELTVTPIDESQLDEDSDGTQGALAPVVGGDGTGGAQEITVPFGTAPNP